jgi:hypothetical protein
MPKFTTVQLIQDFFSPPKVEMAEFKALSKEDRQELADAIAEQRGLTKTVDPNGVSSYS